MSQKERATEFVVFCIENIADRLGVSGSTIFNKLNSIGAISGFLYPSYKSLHTQSKDYILDEIQTYMARHNLDIKQ